MLGGIVALSLIPPPATVMQFQLSDKVLHIMGYAVLMGWFVQVFEGRRSHFWLALGFIALGVSLELLQGMTRYRSFEYLDMLANTTGVVIAWALAATRFATLLQSFERRVIS